MPILSLQQRMILKWLLNRVRFAELHDRQLLETGFWWALEIKNKADENSRRASMSRALARLERRGLVIRVKGRKKARTTRVLLTVKGRNVAESISDN